MKTYSDAYGTPIVDFDTPEESLAHVCALFRRLLNDVPFSIDASMQEATRTFVTGQIGRAEAARSHFRTVGKGEYATQCLALKTLFSAIAAELDVVLAFKRARPHAAWQALIKAQQEAEAASRFWPALQEVSEPYRGRLAELERLMFRKQLFLSPTFIFDQGDLECMLCRQTYGECDHIVGEAYDGEVCRRKIRRIKEVVEISFVDEPAAKYRRAFNIGGTDPITGLPIETKDA